MRGGEISPPPPVSPKAIRRSGKVEKGKRKNRSDDGQKKKKRPPDGIKDDEDDGEADGKGKVVNIIA